VKFSPPGARVHVTTSAADGFATLSVRDTGPGIAAEHLPHIFDRFYRVDASRARSTGGVGLGLAICQSIVHAHGGAIDAESRPGEGSTFTVSIPALLQM
jgi:signal transduction histidine kinase